MKKISAKEIVSLCLKLAIVAAVILGVLATAGVGIFGGSAGAEPEDGNFMGAGDATFNFFTVQSNVWMLIISLVFAVFIIGNVLTKKQVKVPNWLYHIKFMCVTAITLTFLVFSLMLTPSMIAGGNGSYLTSVSNICCHNLVPILSIIDYFVFDTEHRSNKLTFILSAILPIYYLAFALIGSVTGVNFGSTTSKVPYFFMDYEANGWFTVSNGFFGLGVFWWIVILVVVVLAYSAAFIAIKNHIAKRRERKAQSAQA